MLNISETLFHFVGLDGKRGALKPPDDAFATLKAILREQRFRLSINERRWSIPGSGGGSTIMDFKVPMICFTETPIGLIASHMSEFGEFGVGMAINWGHRSGAHNVIYMKDEFGTSYGGVVQRLGAEIKEGPETGVMHQLEVLVGITEDIKFRREREWRVIGLKNARGDFSPKEVSFSPVDMVVLVCPKRFLSDLRTFLDSLPAYRGYTFGIISSEILLGRS